MNKFENELKKSEKEEIKKILEGKNNVLITGENGSGKTELLNYFNSIISERTIFIDDNIENVEQSDDIEILSLDNLELVDSDLFREKLSVLLRNKPENILLDEIKEYEDIKSLEIMNDNGSLIVGTIHAGSVEDALNRLKLLGLSENIFDVVINLSLKRDNNNNSNIRIIDEIIYL